MIMVVLSGLRLVWDKKYIMALVHNKYHNTAPSGAVYIGRGSPYGNPYVIGVDGTRDEVCNKHILMLMENDNERVKIKNELRGKDLVCYCKPARCHGDYLLLIANE